MLMKIKIFKLTEGVNLENLIKKRSIFLCVIIFNFSTPKGTNNIHSKVPKEYPNSSQGKVTADHIPAGKKNLSE